jgi:hypothetical protein
MRRVLFALWTGLLPALALAQQAGGQAPNGTSSRAGYAWLWLLAAVAILVALFRMFFGRPDRTGRPQPPARRP